MQLKASSIIIAIHRHLKDVRVPIPVGHLGCFLGKPRICLRKLVPRHISMEATVQSVRFYASKQAGVL